MNDVIHIFGASGSGTTMARLCHSAFARVATPDLPLSGASGALCHSAFVRVATKLFILCAEQCFLCHSAFARVATVTSKQLPFAKELCHSAFVRVATHCYKLCKIGQTLCLSAFARVATGFLRVYRQRRPLCHSAFVRVATRMPTLAVVTSVFATAHSCGLRRIGASPDRAKRSLPQRIRAGCDMAESNQYGRLDLCHSAFARVATSKTKWYLTGSNFATAHSRGLRL